MQSSLPSNTPVRRLLFTQGQTRYDLVRILETRDSGEQTLLAERYQEFGLGGYVLVKRLETPVTKSRRQRLLEEVALATRLDHPSIARVFQFKLHEGSPHAIMEYVDGPQLETVMQLAALRGAPVSVVFALYVGAELADALHHAHTLADGSGRPLGIVHRDVNPSNVRIHRREGVVKLTDFGAAYSRLVGREGTRDRLLKGDLAYAAPEYLRAERLGPAADVFSLGLVLLELATGRHFFQEEDDRTPVPAGLRGTVNAEETPTLPLTRMLARMWSYTQEDVEHAVAELPPAFRAVLARALQREPDARHATAALMRDELRACLAREHAAGAACYGRKELAEELERLIRDASAFRDEVELGEEGLFPDMLEAHELGVPLGDFDPP